MRPITFINIAARSVLALFAATTASYGRDKAALCDSLNIAATNCVTLIHTELIHMGHRIPILKPIAKVEVTRAEHGARYVWCGLTYEIDVASPPALTKAYLSSANVSASVGRKKPNTAGMTLMIVITDGLLQHNSTKYWEVPLRWQNLPLTVMYYLEVGKGNRHAEDEIKAVVEKHLAEFSREARRLVEEESKAP